MGITEGHKGWQRFGTLLFIMFCLELGLFLLVFPWSDFWERNLFATLTPEFNVLWSNTYFRGAISGLGVLDIYISLLEMFRLLPFSKSQTGAGLH
jgi:hypothetical protein